MLLFACCFFQSGRIGAEEDIDDFKGKTEAEVQEIIEEREAKANAQILKMVDNNKCSNIAHIGVAPIRQLGTYMSCNM